MSLLILAIENHRDNEIDILCEKFIKRMQGNMSASLELLPAARVKIPEEQKIKESETILKYCKPGDQLILCDERGKTFTSKEFATYIDNSLSQSRGRLIFAIGGAYGFTEDLLKSNLSIRLSDFTFPHHLARLVLCEQLYRAFTILKGTGYHHG
ncbi:MAG: 23S rRNA (pseudouridine(1915)-N(3))-methyltransferase RlmH [Bacteroidetes bacterium]|nr:23S rRNA (pseudouridine(1915)-N(3))-methyltransferase RlmH [Bacteroidota bacterium]